MADDWRVTVDLEDGSGEGLGARLSEHDLEDEARNRLGDAVAVSTDGPRAFLYADTREAAESARDVVASLVEREGLKATFSLDRWHPLAEEWKPADEAMPGTAEERDAELEELEAREEEETREAGFAEWEVRLDLGSHGDAVALAERLEAEGIPVTRRWTYLIVGAASREDAGELAERLTAEGPAGTTVHVQPGGEMVWEAAPRRSKVFYIIPNL
jgi:hypothetical protein